MTETVMLSNLFIDRREILRYAGMRGTAPGVDALLDRVISETRPSLKGHICYRLFDVKKTEHGYDFFGTEIASDTLESALGGCQKGVVFAATLGLDADRAMARAGTVSPAKALLTDAFCTQQVEALCDAFCSRMTKNAQGRPRVSPGYGDLSLSLQAQIFSVLEPAKHIGLSLSEALLMSPSKSVTAIFGMEAHS